MKHALARFYQFLDRPITWWSRIVLVVLVVPLLVESGSYAERCDRICVVDVPEEIQLERVMRRSGLHIERIHSIMAAQAKRQTRRGAADDIIDNSGDLAALASQVDALHRSYLELARNPR